ncbi:hypothetical protein [Streptomyces sp. CC219B]|uniref:hypothetical protein n=1 Tax=Streptomyces sp. CC219B TaxID=3044574 RepID=UPI0024A92DE7|nr:hypothetical protein [Streptomyces sp. CC219B]
MGSLKVTLCAGVAAVAALLPPAAYAADGGGIPVNPVPSAPGAGGVPVNPAAPAPGTAGVPVNPAPPAPGTGGISVSPPSPAPGSDIALRVTGCAERTATAVSAAFVSEVRLALAGTDGTLVGESRVRGSIEAGSYEVEVTCGGTARRVALTVGAEPSAPASPVAPVSAGGGGTAAHLAEADARTTGPGTAHAVVGLVLAGVAATAVALRSARRSRGTE